MKFIENEDAIQREDCYFCYSLNLHRFLKDEKQIYHVNCGKHKVTQKMWFTYLKTEFLDEALKEWTKRKDNNRYINHKSKEVINE